MPLIAHSSGPLLAWINENNGDNDEEEEDNDEDDTRMMIRTMAMRKRGRRTKKNRTSKLTVDDAWLAVRYTLPLSELGSDFYDALKSRSRGYASFDYEEGDYR